MRLQRVVGLVVLVASSCLAHADSVPVSGSGGGFSGTGTLYTSETSDAQGGYTIENITGTGVISLLGSGTFQNNDNLLFPGSSPVLDGQGFAFIDTNGDTNFDVDLFYSTTNGDYEARLLDNDGVSMLVPVTFSLTEGASPSSIREFAALPSDTSRAYQFAFAETATTPEPTSIAFLGTGLLGLAGVLRKRKQ